jgi:predicted aspartyl protease
MAAGGLRMRSLLLALLLTLTVWDGPGRAAEQCPPLTILGSEPMQIGVDGRIYVKATVNGAPVSMLVDTGGFFAELTPALVSRLNLPTRHVRLRLIGLSGHSTDIAVSAPFALGNMHADGMDFMVMPADHAFAPDVPDAGGILAPNLFRHYDLDLDIAGHRLQLISQDHCDGKVVYWKANALAEVPVRIAPTGHVLVPIGLDGHTLTALLDTGATVSLLNMSVAQSQFGLMPDVPPRASMPGAPRVATHIFRALSFAGVAVSNPRLVMLPDLIHGKISNAGAGAESRMPDVILGMDILRHLHLYIAYKEQKLYITPADVPLPATAATAAAVHPPK